MKSSGKKWVFGLFFFVLIAGFPGMAPGQEGLPPQGKPLNLDQCIELALKYQPTRRVGTPNRNTHPMATGKGKIIMRDAHINISAKSFRPSADCLSPPSNTRPAKRTIKKRYSTTGTNAVMINAMIVLNMVFI